MASKMASSESIVAAGDEAGGKTVMQFAAEHEDLIERLVVADMGIQTYSSHHDLVLKTLHEFPFSDIKTRKEADAWMETRIEDFGVRQFLLKNLVRDKDSDNEFRWKFNFPVLHRDYENILQAVESDYPIHTETLFIRGGKSEYVRDEDFGDIQVLFPNAQFDTVEGAGHWLHAEKPVEFFQKTLQFLTA